MALYIEHEDIQTPSNGRAVFGPFDEAEVTERVNDAYADLLAGSGNVDVVELTDSEAGEIYVNPRAYWLEQLASIRDFEREHGVCGQVLRDDDEEE